MSVQTVIYVTGNKSKFKSAQGFLAPLGITTRRVKLNLEEIQSESIETISRRKAAQAFQRIRSPLFVNDSGWLIPALNGFPGPYMKFINQWFTAEDFLSLMIGKVDRRVILRQVITFTDGNQVKVFSHDVQGLILKEARGNSGIPSDRIISFSRGLSWQEDKEQGAITIKAERQLWIDFASWLNSNQQSV